MKKLTNKYQSYRLDRHACSFGIIDMSHPLKMKLAS